MKRGTLRNWEIASNQSQAASTAKEPSVVIQWRLSDLVSIIKTRTVRSPVAKCIIHSKQNKTEESTSDVYLVA